MIIMFVGMDIELKKTLGDKAGMLLEDKQTGLCTMDFYDILSVNYIPEEDAVVVIRKTDCFKISRNMYAYAEFR